MIEPTVPRVHRQFWDLWEVGKHDLLAPYLTHRTSFVPSLLPEQSVQMTAEDTLSILRARLGGALNVALNSADPDGGCQTVAEPIRSPVADRADGSWLRLANIVGINVRTIGSFWNVIKYALTLPAVQDAIHLLPIWEPGVVGSLYGMSSWQINTEFYSEELAQAWPALDTVERQLKAVINLLHALGRAVGMDVIPHTDRFSEIALAFPQFFEWLQRQDTEIVDHAESLHEKVQESIMRFLDTRGPALAEDPYPQSRAVFFSEAFPEAQRLQILFGPPSDRKGRSERRNQLVRYLHAYGYEPVPATMAPPFRGLKINPASKYVDSQGNTWYDYAITKPQLMSRVFNPLARYKLYGRLHNNRNWEIDFDNPRSEVWRYVCEKYYRVQCRYGFDFMRGDMSHVQMRPEGVPERIDEYYDILRAVKRHIQKEKGVRFFGYFAESFLAPRGIMVYGDEVDHLEASDADSTLGDLQSTSVGSPAFLQRLRQYHDLLTVRSFAPSFTVMTGDKDDPRFDAFYLRGSALRLFLAFFLTDMPSYMALGFETRDIHYEPAANEHYTKLYVFQERVGPKATSGPYAWGRNGVLYSIVTRLRLYADAILSQITGRPIQWLIHPDPAGNHKHLAWTQRDGKPDYVFVANTDTEDGIRNFSIPRIPHSDGRARLVYEFSTSDVVPSVDRMLAWRYKGYNVAELAAGEGRVYRVVDVVAEESHHPASASE